MNELIKHGIASFIILVFTAVFYIQSLTLPSIAANLPQLIIYIIALLAILMFIQEIIKYRKPTKNQIKKEESILEEDDDEEINHKRVLTFLVMIALYILTIEKVGYFIVTPIFAIISLLYLTTTRLINVILISVGFTIGIYFIFVTFLKIPIPMGLFPI